MEKHLNLEVLIRYGASGFVAIICLSFPIMIVYFKVLIETISIGNFLGIIAISMVLGYLLDNLKLYQFTPGYSKRKNTFNEALASRLGIDKERVTPYFALLIHLTSNDRGINLERKQAEWHLLENSSKIFFLFTIEWIVIFIQQTQMTPWHYDLNIKIFCILMILTGVVFTRRLFKTSEKERKKIDQIFLKYAETNKASGLDKYFDLTQV